MKNNQFSSAPSKRANSIEFYVRYANKSKLFIFLTMRTISTELRKYASLTMPKEPSNYWKKESQIVKVMLFSIENSIHSRSVLSVKISWN